MTDRRDSRCGGHGAGDGVHRATPTWSSFPEAVKEKACLCLIDDLGAVLAGLAAPVSRIAAEYAAAQMPGRQATVVATGALASASGAAFANGCAANAVDIDDCGIYTWGHPGAALLPAALAVAEAEHRSGAELLTALVVGYEVAFRAARCFHHHHASTAHAPHGGRWRVPPSPLTSCVCRWLRSRHALGIAEYFSPYVPMMRGVAEPSMVKHGIGWGAHDGRGGRGSRLSRLHRRLEHHGGTMSTRRGSPISGKTTCFRAASPGRSTPVVRGRIQPSWRPLRSSRSMSSSQRMWSA